jgi:S-formylglutathione hydrolase
LTLIAIEKTIVSSVSSVSLANWPTLRLISEHGCFGGVQYFFEHDSGETKTPMRFSVYMPAQAKQGPIPTIVYLAGLTCTEETFMIKAGAQRLASELGIALVAPDTSPRKTDIPGQAQSWDFGVAAGFYIDATQTPWAHNWRMESYLIKELIPSLPKVLPIDLKRLSIMGHSMGGHGALTLALKHPEMFKCVSAFAPICAPTQCPWGRKAFSGYLGEDETLWASHDASSLMRSRGKPLPFDILIDQGQADKFLTEQLHPHVFEQACAEVKQGLTLRLHAGYDHGYYFVSTLIDHHLQHHYRYLAK